MKSYEYAEKNNKTENKKTNKNNIKSTKNDHEKLLIHLLMIDSHSFQGHDLKADILYHTTSRSRQFMTQC